MVQNYLGADSDLLSALIAAKQQARASVIVRTQAMAAARLGLMTITGAHLRVINRLADEGFFRAGGLLVGTHAFLAAGNMLGVRWKTSERTQDLDPDLPFSQAKDLVHAGSKMSVALPSNAKLELGDVIDSLKMGFVPAASLDGLRGGRFINPADPGFVLDFLTPTNRTNKSLIHVKAFNAEFQALPYLEFSLEDVQQAAVLSNTNACLVNTPDPARFAVHKLIVSVLRSSSQRTKAIYQLLQTEQPGRLEQVERDANARGPKWRRYLAEGKRQLENYLDTQPIV